jgi:hypothetical protein
LAGSEVQAELARLQALESELTRLLEHHPRPGLSGDGYRGGRLVVRPATVLIPASRRKGGDRHAAAGLSVHARRSLRRLPARLLLDQPARPTRPARRHRSRDHGAAMCAATIMIDPLWRRAIVPSRYTTSGSLKKPVRVPERDALNPSSVVAEPAA